jgi:secreted Zn-dependent insulinase-like peptidase
MNLEIDYVISSLRDKIYGIPDSKFKEVVSSIQNELFKKDTNLKERSKKVWSEIQLNTLDFKRKDKLLEEVTKITKSNIIDAFDYIFIDKPQKLSIQIYAGNFSKMKSEMEEVYYLNSNVKVKVTSDINAIDDLNSLNNEDNHK